MSETSTARLSEAARDPVPSLAGSRIVVTVPATETDPPWLSLITNVHVPAATAVIVNVVAGPVPADGEIVAMPVHDGTPLDVVNVPG